MKSQIPNLKWDKRGLIPAIVQNAETGEVLTLAYMNAESLRLTLETGETWFWSRSRGELWHKKATSGNTQRVVEVRYDCDGDALLVRVAPAGQACHTGEQTCFHNFIRFMTKPCGLSSPQPWLKLKVFLWQTGLFELPNLMNLSPFWLTKFATQCNAQNLSDSLHGAGHCKAQKKMLK